MRRTTIILCLISAFSFSLIAAGNEDFTPSLVQRYYNEMFDLDGQVRPQYREMYEIYSEMSRTKRQKFRSEFRNDFQGDNAMAASVRILTHQEQNHLRLGVEQRARALFLFLQDHYSGSKQYLSQGIIPAQVMQRILARYGENQYDGQLDPRSISFPYGPDVIRVADGSWRVLEDNTGLVGGRGDLILAREALLKRIPDYDSVFADTPQAQEFFSQLVEFYRSKLVRPRDALVLFMSPPYSDHEDLRLKKIFSDLGVEVVSAHTKNQLVVKTDGVYLLRPGSSRSQRVGVVINLCEQQDLDLTHSLAENIWLLKEAQYQLWSDEGKKILSEKTRNQLEQALSTLLPGGDYDFAQIRKILSRDSEFKFELGKARALTVPGLMQAALEGKVFLEYSPGTDFVSDKEFYTYVEDLIRFYLSEEPVLRNVATKRLYKVNSQGDVQPETEALKDLAENFDKYVVKFFDGRGGDSIWIGPKLSEAERENALQIINKNYFRAKMQDFVHPSVLDQDIVDYRILAQVSADGSVPRVLTAPVGWSRGVSISGNGKVNLGAKGHELAVALSSAHAEPLMCQQILQP